MDSPKRKRRTKQEMEEFRNQVLSDITKKELQETFSDNTSTASISPKSDVILEDEGDSEDIDDKEALQANFIISDGKRDLKIRAFKNYWALQSWVETKDKDTKEVKKAEWVSFKYFANLGQLANRIFDFRLKNSDVSSLNELTEVARKLAIDIKKEFEVNLK